MQYLYLLLHNLIFIHSKIFVLCCLIFHQYIKLYAHNAPFLSTILSGKKTLLLNNSMAQKFVRNEKLILTKKWVGYLQIRFVTSRHRTVKIVSK